MKWKKWLIGAVSSFVLSVFVALAGVAAGVTWQQFLSILGAALVTHFGAYLQKHPPESIEMGDTQIITKPKDGQ